MCPPLSDVCVRGALLARLLCPSSHLARVYSGPVWRPVLELGMGIHDFKSFLKEHLVTIIKTIEPGSDIEPELQGYVTTEDGVKIRYAKWKAAVAPVKGTVLVLQGRTEYIEKYLETVRDLRNKGFEVLAFDWRGQGGSDRLLEDTRKGYVDEYSEYLLDLDAIIADVALPDCKSPFYILGHSTGALVALLAAPKIPNKVRRMVLCSPLLGIGKQPISQGAIKVLSGSMTALGLADTYLGGGGTPNSSKPFIGNNLTSDLERYERNKKFSEEHRNLTIGSPTAAWIFASCKAMDRVSDPDFFADINIPSLFVLAGRDEVVDNQAAEYLAARLRAGSLLTIDGAKHELLQEKDFYREQLLAAFFAFVPGSDTAG